MNRFFSKLDLRDIKIDPQGSHFPPDEDDEGGTAQASSVESIATETAPEAFDRTYVPSWTTALPDGDGYESGAVIATDGIAPEVEYIEQADGEIARNGEVLKVSARSRPSAVAGAIAGVVRESGRAEVQAIGAGATNQAVKAVAIARDYLRETGIEAVCLPAFIDVVIDNEDRTAILLVVEPR
jgi:stage V sporulation protein S